MKRFVFLLLLMISAFGLGQTTNPGPSSIDKQMFQPGAVVEEVTKNSAAEKAGLQEGDVLLAWTRDDATGKIESPFDVSVIATEQAPRGAISLKGLRGLKESAWTIEPGSWGLKTRPNLSGSLFAILPSRPKAG
jgi:S1-C subfamily serine protease